MGAVPYRQPAPAVQAPLVPQRTALEQAVYDIATKNASRGKSVEMRSADNYLASHPFSLTQQDPGGYYAARTNDNDVAATVQAAPGARSLLLDAKGRVVYSGEGPQGAQEVASLASYMSKTQGAASAWNIATEKTPGAGDFNIMAGDQMDAPRGFTGLVAKAAPIVGTVLGSLLGAPMIGSAIGNALGSSMQGADLKGTLLSAAAGGAGAGIGGAISNGLGSLGASGVAQGAGQGVTSGLSQVAAQTGANALGHTLGELVVTAPARAGLGAVAGAAAGGLAGGSLAQALHGANAGATGPTTSAGPGSGVTEVSPIEVVAGHPVTPFNPLTVAGGAISGMAPFTQPNDLMTSEGTQQEMKYDLQHNQPLDWGQIGRDTVGDAAGDVIAGYGTMALGKLLGWIPTSQQAPGAPATGTTPAADNPRVAIDRFPDAPGGGGPNPVAPTAPGVSPGVSLGGGAGGGGSSAAGAAPGLLSTGGSSGAGGAAAAAPAEIKSQGSLAPEVYPWRKLGH